MLKTAMSEFRSDLSLRLRDIAEKQFPANLKPMVVFYEFNDTLIFMKIVTLALQHHDEMQWELRRLSRTFSRFRNNIRECTYAIYRNSPSGVM